MKIDRKELLKALAEVKPALSGQDFIPILTHYCFTDEGHLYAFNDVMAIFSDIKIGMVGGIPGDSFYRIVNSFSGKEITIEGKGNKIKVRSGRSSFELATLPEDEFYLDIEEHLVNPEINIPVNDDLLKGFESCLLSVGEDEVHPEHMGIVLSCVDGVLSMYSTDNITLSRCLLDGFDCDDFDQVILPKDFCLQLINRSLSVTVDSCTLEIGKDHALLLSDDQVKVYTKLLNKGSGENFEDIFDRFSDYTFTNYYDVTKGLEDSLNRSLILLGNVDFKVTKIIIGLKNDIELNTETQLGKGHDKLQFRKVGIRKKNKIKKTVEIGVNPELLLRACNSPAYKISFGEKVILLTDDENFTHVIATTQ